MATKIKKRKKAKNKKVHIDIKNIIWRITTSFSFGFSFAACTGFNTVNCLISASIYALLNKSITGVLPITYYLIYLISGYVLNTSGLLSVIILFVLSAVISVLVKRKCDIKFKKDSPEFSGLILSTALTVTCIATTDYFGIGAYGNTFVEMIKNYVSLGFHPNWRGILFGTIVMVIMITFPRKFKSFSKYCKASFIALWVTLLFNLFMLTKSMPEFYRLSHYTAFNYPTSADIHSLILPKNILILILCIISLSILLLTTVNNSEIKSSLSVIQTAAAFTPSFPGNINENLSDWINGILSALIVSSTLFCSNLFERIPVASCAVVLIVGVWQSINWSNIAANFKSLKNISILLVLFLFTTITSPFAGILLSFIISLIRKETKITLKPGKEFTDEEEKQ